jgi:hypothetical protein
MAKESEMNSDLRETVGKMARQYQWLPWEIEQDQDTGQVVSMTYMNAYRTASISVTYDAANSIVDAQVLLHSAKNGTRVAKTPEVRSQCDRDAQVLSWFILYSKHCDESLFYDEIPRGDIVNSIAALLAGKSLLLDGVPSPAKIENVGISLGGWLTLSFKNYGPVVIAFTSLTTG